MKAEVFVEHNGVFSVHLFYSIFILTLNSVQVWAYKVSGLNLSLKIHGTALKHHLGWEVKATRHWMKMRGEREGIQTEAGW